MEFHGEDQRSLLSSSKGSSELFICARLVSIKSVLLSFKF